MKAKIKNPMMFFKLFEALNNLLVEVKMKITSKSLDISEIDDGKICLVDLSLKVPEVFEDFELELKEGEDHEEVSITLEYFVKLLRRMHKYEDLEFITNGKEIGLIGSGKKKMSLFTINKEDSHIKPEALRKIKQEIQVNIQSLELVELIKDAKIYAESLTFDYKDEILTASAEGCIGVFTSPVKILEEYSEEGKKANHTFSLQYLRDTMKIANMYGKPNSKAFENSEITFMMKGGDSPCKISMIPIGCVNSFIDVYTAPRIEEEEDEDDW